MSESSLTLVPGLKIVSTNLLSKLESFFSLSVTPSVFCSKVSIKGILILTSSPVAKLVFSVRLLTTETSTVSPSNTLVIVASTPANLSHNVVIIFSVSRVSKSLIISVSKEESKIFPICS
ncbi:Uncharacterised protein [Mycoplasmopsis arginini]|nr:Uncharacterised protein [Chlamydia abortus]SGA07876.1 Uncharacterised protein [Mycoplasmopsis arginini]SGA08842.1 Uncharacterised protein [Mycoplasmopsis arginini]SGA31861.1 Uncharacterised protein [Chlamydia abortus]